MADISYGGGGGGGGGYYPPFFDPNNPMGGGGGVPNGNYSPSGASSYYSSAVRYADPSLTTEWFSQNFQSSNPYTQFYSHQVLDENLYKLNYIFASGNTYQMVDAGSRTIVIVTNNAYTDFENKATAAQNTYLSQQQSAFNEANDKASSDLIASYGRAAIQPTTKNDIATLADLNAKVAELQFQDDITRYLNRVTDSSNINTINDLKNQIAALQNSLSDRLMDYWRQQEIIKQKNSEFFTWDFAWLSDPYFGRGVGDQQLYQAYIKEQQYLSNNISMIADGSIYDWLAGGMYLNAVMPGGDMAAGYMPNDYYSVGLQYQVTGSDLNEGGSKAFPWDSMAGGASFGMNSKSRAAYRILEL